MMMAVLLLILVPLAALLIGAVVFDLRQRRLRGAAGMREISPDKARAKAEAERAVRKSPGGHTGGIWGINP
jgi:cytochrome c-type biogenesis protein CcmH/NrfF